MLSDTGRVLSGTAHEGGFADMSLYEQDCVRAEYLRACLGEAYRLERAQGLRVRPNAQGWGPDWGDFMDDAVDHYCDDQGGGTPGARGLVRVLSDSAEESGRSCSGCAAH